MAEVPKSKLKLEFDFLQSRSEASIFWATVEDWVQDCEILGVILPVFRAAGVLNLIEISSQNSISFNPSWNRKVYHLLNECDLIFDDHFRKGKTFEVEIRGSNLHPKGFTPTPESDSTKGFYSTDVPGIYLPQWNYERDSTNPNNQV